MSFKEVIGQESALTFLRSAYRHGRLSHAYVFVGPDGVGKKKTALNFAKLLVCEKPRQEEPCETCPSCVKASGSNHPDIQWVGPEGQFIKIDAVREARRRLNLKGFESSRKVLVILEAQNLNEESSNALLKTLEEPTAHTTILLLTNTLKGILPTIASRCQRIVFSVLRPEAVCSILCEQGGVGRQEAVYLSRLSEGSPGVAFRYHEERLFERKDRIIGDVLNSSGSLEDFFALSLKDRTERNARVDETLCVLSSWFRDLFLAKVAGDYKGFINSDRIDDIMQASRSFSLSQIEERLAFIADTARDLKRNINPRFLAANLRAELWK